MSYSCRNRDIAGAAGNLTREATIIWRRAAAASNASSAADMPPPKLPPPEVADPEPTSTGGVGVAGGTAFAGGPAIVSLAIRLVTLLVPSDTTTK
jgi:hypothetical protein